MDMDSTTQGHAAAAGATRAPANPTNPRVVILENFAVHWNRKSLEPELYRIAPWLYPQAVEVMHSGGLRVVCKTPADADKLVKRDGFPDNAFGGSKFTIHRPGSTDPTRPISARMEKESRTVLSSTLPIHYTADEIRHLMHPDYLDEIRDIPPKDFRRPPLRVVVLKSKAMRDDAIENGLIFMNRRVKARPLRCPILPLLCRHCFKFGHVAIDCKSPTPFCGKCSSTEHTVDDCHVDLADACCPNCPDPLPGEDQMKRKHFGYYRGCPAHQEASRKEAEARLARAEEKEKKARAIEQRRNQERSQKPAPVQPGRSFLAAASARIPSTSTPATPSAAVTQHSLSPDNARLYQLLKEALEQTRKDLEAKIDSVNTRLHKLEHDVDNFIFDKSIQINSNANTEMETLDGYS
jgi:hypothetical protein